MEHSVERSWDVEIMRSYAPFCNVCLTHSCHFLKKKQKNEYKKCITLIGVRIRLGLFFELSTLRLNAVVHPFDPFLMKGLLEFGFWSAIQESMDCIHLSVIQMELTIP